MIAERREYRSPHRVWGWVIIGLAIVGTAVFFAGVDWSEFEGRLVDYLNLAKVPLCAWLVVFLGLRMSWCALVVSETGILVRNIFQSVHLRWVDGIGITEDENGIVRVRSRAHEPVRVYALSRLYPYGQRHRWQSAAIDEVSAILGSHEVER